MVAKSYQNFEIITEPYNVDGRMYVDVKSPKGVTKRVRWYTDAQYAKMYPGEVDVVKKLKTLKEINGFSTGSIVIFYGENTYDNKEWFKEQGARYNNYFGWYMPDGKEFDENLPEGTKTAVVNWTDVAVSDDKFKPEKQIKDFVDSLIYEPDESEFYGEVGERVRGIEVTVEKNITLEGYYGTSHMHIMKDEAGHKFVWTTTSKDWREGEVKKINGTIKEHSLYKNSKQTVLTRCQEVK